MALLGKAAMILSFNIVPEAIEEHDDWHSHEHLRERMSIPGFLRGSRWVASTAEPNYFVMYEVSDLDVLASQAYLERLNNPTPWTAKMMAHYRGMMRGFCRLSCSYGLGLGNVGLLIRFCPGLNKESLLRAWLCGDVLPTLPSRQGLVSAHLFEAALKPEPTQEQRIRGADGGIDWVLLITGFSAQSITRLADNEFSREQFMQRGAVGITADCYTMMHSLTDKEADIPDVGSCVPYENSSTLSLGKN